jgi:hypothetical protein
MVLLPHLQIGGGRGRRHHHYPPLHPQLARVCSSC